MFGEIKKFTLGIFLLLIIWVQPNLSAENELVLMDTNGREIVANIVSADEKVVEIYFNGKKYKMPWQKLDIESQKKAKEFAKENDLFKLIPDINFDVIVRTRNVRQKGSSYMMDHIIQPKLKLSGEILKDPLPAISARCLIICVETKSKYVSRDEKLEIRGDDTIEIPAAENGKEREFLFPELKTQYDKERDYTNIGGWSYRYYIFLLSEKKSGKIVRWDTNIQVLENKLREDPAYIKRIAKLKLKSPFKLNF